MRIEARTQTVNDFPYGETAPHAPVLLLMDLTSGGCGAELFFFFCFGSRCLDGVSRIGHERGMPVPPPRVM